MYFRKTAIDFKVCQGYKKCFVAKYMTGVVPLYWSLKPVAIPDLALASSLILSEWKVNVTWLVLFSTRELCVGSSHNTNGAPKCPG